MKIKYQWFLGGKVMFVFSIILFCVLILGFICTYIVDPIGTLTIKKVIKTDITTIQEISEQYVESLGVENIDIPITYRFVRFRQTNKKEILMGTFHKWNNTYYIDINSDLLLFNDMLRSTVVHETRHLIVAFLKDKKIIDLMDYSEEIARGINPQYDNLFNSGVYLYKTNGPNHEVLIQK